MSHKLWQLFVLLHLSRKLVICHKFCLKNSWPTLTKIRISYGVSALGNTSGKEIIFIVGLANCWSSFIFIWTRFGLWLWFSKFRLLVAWSQSNFTINCETVRSRLLSGHLIICVSTSWPLPKVNFVGFVVGIVMEHI